MTTATTTHIDTPTTRNASTAATSHVTFNPFSIGGVTLQRLERTFGDPRNVGDGARRAVHRFGEALEQLSE
jgi:hypothetical protein